MTEKDKLELAAKAMGLRLEWDGPPDKWHPMYYEGKTYHAFEPHTNQADSDRMACKLRIELRHRSGKVWASLSTNSIIQSVTHNNTDEDVCRAVREARLMVAVEIGRAK